MNFALLFAHLIFPLALLCLATTLSRPWPYINIHFPDNYYFFLRHDIYPSFYLDAADDTILLLTEGFFSLCSDRGFLYYCKLSGSWETHLSHSCFCTEDIFMDSDICMVYGEIFVSFPSLADCDIILITPA